ncbi:MAG: hypothetical protein M3Z95_06145 [Actinomycetota bacterium]|nr:hypothetical protein [Actinomycetota bacterium]
MLTVACAASAYGAFVGLPSNGAQVNNDGSAIDPAQSVNRSDLTAGSLTAGAARVPWATFDQPAAGGGPGQIFVRAFKNGAWQTEGFPESLNFSTGQPADSPSIDFTGPGRTVPWVGWAEPSLGATQIFASRFAPSAGQNGGQWAQEGQGRTTVPSLNINTNRNADFPALIGGTTIAGGNPAPWITWQEFDGPGATPTSGSPQIFVSHAVPAATGCKKPEGPGLAGHNFCFQQVGLDRVIGPAASQFDPSLNIDPSRSGIESDIAFTGPNDTVPWVVWYENSDSNGKHPSTLGLQNQDMVFAAKAVADASGDGGFHWQVVGLGTAGQTNLLDTSGAKKFGPCAESIAAENGCSLNVGPTNNLEAGSGAENPSVTAGTMVPGSNTTPWISWDENSSNGGQHSVFVARLDKAGDHYNLLNNGQPLSHSGFDSTRSDIVFVRNTPYVSWHETNGSGQTVTVVGHFEGNPANPVFHLDTPAAGVGTTPAGKSDVRSPIASTCPDDPFTGDGSACPGGSVGTPFYAFNAGMTPQSLFSQAYTPGAAQTGGAPSISQTGATVAGSVNTDGAPTRVYFDFGTSTAYGSISAPQLLAPAAGTTTAVSAALAGLPAGTVIHYRVVAQTDFGTVAGADAAFTTAPAPLPLPPPIVSNVSQSHRIWRAGSRRVSFARRHRPPVGTRFSFTLNEQATVSFAFTQQVGGRRVKGRCVSKTKKNRHKRACKRTVTKGRLSFTGHSGANKVSFQGRISASQKLRLGHYTLVITATNTVGQSSSPQRLSFTIVK